MAFSKQFRYRNLGGQRSEYRRRQPENLRAVAIVGVVLLACFGCLGIGVGFVTNVKLLNRPLPSFNPLASTPKATATPNLKGEVALNSKGLNENGLELTVTSFQRPLQVQGLAKIPADQQFVLVSVTIRNTKTTGQPIKVDPANFKLKGDGGLTYDANPKTVTIDQLMTAADQVMPGKELQSELIFQTARDDSGLKLYWTVGKTTRVFVLEPVK